MPPWSWAPICSRDEWPERFGLPSDVRNLKFKNIILIAPPASSECGSYSFLWHLRLMACTKLSEGRWITKLPDQDVCTQPHVNYTSCNFFFSIATFSRYANDVWYNFHQSTNWHTYVSPYRSSPWGLICSLKC